MTPEWADRFWTKVNKDGLIVEYVGTPCWDWTAGTDCRGRGCFRISRKIVRYGYQVAWFLTYGEWSELPLLHACDRPSCCRPDHLRKGTQKENMQDMAAKGRAPRKLGEKNNRSVLKEHQVIEILSSELTVSQLARDYGVGRSTVACIKARRTWVHIKL